MWSFSIDRRLSVALVMALAAAIPAALLVERHKPRHPQETEPRVESLAFGHISAPLGARGSLKIQGASLLEFRVAALGSEQVAVACDRDFYWFWVRSYDPRRYYFCGSDETSRVGVSPLFSPAFIRCASGAEFAQREHPEDGEILFSEDGLAFVARFRGGRITGLVCSADGGERVEIEFLTHQRAGGHWFPRRLKASMDSGSSIELDMGDVEINPSEPPRTNPPQGMQGSRLEIRR